MYIEVRLIKGFCFGIESKWGLHAWSGLLIGLGIITFYISDYPGFKLSFHNEFKGE